MSADAPINTYIWHTLAPSASIPLISDRPISEALYRMQLTLSNGSLEKSNPSLCKTCFVGIYHVT